MQSTIKAYHQATQRVRHHGHAPGVSKPTTRLLKEFAREGTWCLKVYCEELAEEELEAHLPIAAVILWLIASGLLLMLLLLEGISRTSASSSNSTRGIFACLCGIASSSAVSNSDEVVAPSLHLFRD